MNSRLNFNLLIWFLGVSVLVCIVGGLLLTFTGKQVPDSIIGVGGTALGGLITAFVHPPNNDVVPVKITDEPVEVTPPAKKSRKKG